MSYPPADAPKDVAELLSHRVEGETSDEDVDVDENMTQDAQDRPAALQGIPYIDDEPDAEGDHQQNQPHEQDQPCYTDEERLVWLEQRVLQYERHDAVHQADVDALAKRANKQTRLIKQIQELQNEDHPVLMSVASTTTRISQELRGMAPAQAQGSAPGQGTSSPELLATSSQAMHQSMSSGQGSASQWPPPAASPPDLMDFDLQPLPSGAMEPSRQEIVAAAQLLRRAAATQSINGFVPAGPAPSPDNWRPHFTPQYPSGSREQLYASALDLCFHCGEKVNVPGKPRIPGAHDRGLHNCPVKMANGMPTPIVVPDAWTPPRKPGFN